jgi:hypothetical protein
MHAGCANRPANSLITGVSTGTFNCTTPTIAGSTCSFTCNSGVPLPGSAPVCQAGGTWVNNAAAAGPPACVECVADTDCTGGNECVDNACETVAPAVRNDSRQCTSRL